MLLFFCCFFFFFFYKQVLQFFSLKNSSKSQATYLKNSSQAGRNGSQEDSTKMVFEAPPLKALNDLIAVAGFLPFTAFNCHSVLFLGRSLTCLNIAKLTSMM